MERAVIDFAGDGQTLLAAFAGQPHCVLLESSLVHPRLGRYSFLGLDPFRVVTLRADGDLADLRRQFRRAFPRPSGRPGPRLSPLEAGMMGCLDYDSGLAALGVASRHPRDGALPGGWFGFYDCILTVDHVAGKLIVTASGRPETQPRLRRIRARERLRRVLHLLSVGLNTPSPRRSRTGTGRLRLTSNMTKAEYLRRVRAALGYIRRGDIYQLNLAQRFAVPPAAGLGLSDGRALYTRLRAVSASCFGAYLDAGSFQVISSSPERFLSLRGRAVETRPMKGTRPRGADRRSDGRLRQALCRSAKEQAELLMITDLMRNDLGRVCRFGSVRVDRLREIEAYRTVYQATSTVTGELAPGRDGLDVLAACVPGGSVTGCPKIRAVEIIDELEPGRRGFYTGSAGYIDQSGDMDFNILIRTLLLRERQAVFHVGSGIVADSDPEAEYAETLVKAAAIRECLAGYLGGDL